MPMEGREGRMGGKEEWSEGWGVGGVSCYTCTLQGHTSNHLVMSTVHTCGRCARPQSQGHMAPRPHAHIKPPAR